MLPQTYRQNIVSKFPRATLLQEGTHPLVGVMDTQDPAAGWVVNAHAARPRHPTPLPYLTLPYLTFVTDFLYIQLTYQPIPYV